MLNNIKSRILLIKETRFFFFALQFFFIPFYNFLWEFIINFQGKVYYFLWNFKKRGFYDLKNNDKLLVKDNPKFISIANEISDFIDDNFVEQQKRNLENKINNRLLESRNIDSYNQYEDYRTSIYEELSDELKKKIINFALSEENITTAARYLKVFPIIGKIQVGLNIPVKNKGERGAQLWHKDDFGYKSLDIFMTIRDLDETNGPLFFVKSRHPLGVFFKIKDVVKNAKPGERNKVELDKFKKYYLDDDTDSLKGKCGDALFVDSFTTYHRGGFCISKDRLMFRISYQTPEATRVQKIDHSQGFYFCQNIKKENFNDIYKKYVLFKKLNFIGRIINLPEKLVSLYKLMHYKK